MYFVKYGSEYLHDPRVGLILPSANLSTEINKSDIFTFEITPDSKKYDFLLERNSDKKIQILNNDILVFRGEITSISQNFIGTKTITCTSELAYLNNIIVRPHSTDKDRADNMFPKRPKDYVIKLLDEHNKLSSKKERFKLNIESLDWMDELDDLSIVEDGYLTVSELLDTYILSLFSCRISIEYEKYNRTISILKETDKKPVRTIDFGYNLLDYTKEINCEGVCSYVIPFGATINSDSYEIPVEKKPEPAHDPYPNIFDTDSVTHPSEGYKDPNGSWAFTCYNNSDGSVTINGKCQYIAQGLFPIGKIKTKLKYDSYYLFKAICVTDDNTIINNPNDLGRLQIAVYDKDGNFAGGWTPYLAKEYLNDPIIKQIYNGSDIPQYDDISVLFAPASRVEYINYKIYFMIVELPYFDEQFYNIEYRKYSSTSGSSNDIYDKFEMCDDPKEKISKRITLSSESVDLLQKAYDYNAKAKNDAYERYNELISDPLSKQTDIDQAIRDYIEATDESQKNSNYLEDAKINTIDKEITKDFVKTGDIVYSKEAVERYGWIGKSISIDDEYSVGRLLQSAINTLIESETFVESIDVRAIDVDFMTTNKYKDTIKVGDYIKIVSKPHDLNVTMLCVNIEYDLVNPSNNVFSIGKTLQTYTSGIHKKNIDTKKIINVIDKKADKIDIESWRRARRIEAVKEEVEENKKNLLDFKDYYQGDKEEVERQLLNSVSKESFGNLDQYAITNFTNTNTLFKQLWNKVFGTDPPLNIGNDRYEK